MRRLCRKISIVTLLRATGQILAVPHSRDSEKEIISSYRVNGNLSREGFVFVSMMSCPEQRLFKVAQRVGLSAHGLSKSYFDIADPISRVLIQIEASGTRIAPSLLVLGPLQDAMNNIITHWSIITGRDAKAGKVAVR